MRKVLSNGLQLAMSKQNKEEVLRREREAQIMDRANAKMEEATFTMQQNQALRDENARLQRENHELKKFQRLMTLQGAFNFGGSIGDSNMQGPSGGDEAF